MTWPIEVREVILERIAKGESLRSVCRDKDMPDDSAVYRWLEADKEFATKYASARAIQADRIVDDFHDLEEQVLTGDIKPDAAKVVLWSRQWRAAKLRPKVYGDKVEHEHKGGMTVTLTAADKAL